MERTINEFTKDGKTYTAWRLIEHEKQLDYAITPCIVIDSDALTHCKAEYLGWRPEPITPDGRLAVDVFMEWARNWLELPVEWEHPEAQKAIYAMATEMSDKLSELGLLPKPEPIDAEKLAAAETRIKELEAQVRTEGIAIK